MGNETKGQKRTIRGETARVARIDNPLDFIAEDHMREREVCALIGKLVSGEAVSRQERKQMLEFLNVAMPQHLADEEVDLFPLMLERCAPEDEIGKVIDKLLSDHRYAIADTPAIADIIAAEAKTSHGFSQCDADKLSGFADKARRHLILENAIILPIAKARLTPADLAQMKKHMLERRAKTGLSTPQP